MDNWGSDVEAVNVGAPVTLIHPNFLVFLKWQCGDRDRPGYQKELESVSCLIDQAEYSGAKMQTQSRRFQTELSTGSE
jgi:hypothetical protein